MVHTEVTTLTSDGSAEVNNKSESNFVDNELRMIAGWHEFWKMEIKCLVADEI